MNEVFSYQTIEKEKMMGKFSKRLLRVLTVGMAGLALAGRSEERRVGKVCSCRWSSDTEQ